MSGGDIPLLTTHEQNEPSLQPSEVASRKQNRFMMILLELQTQRELQKPGVTHGAADQSGLDISDRGVGLSELRMIEQIEALGPERHFDSLVDFEILDQRKIEVDAAGAKQGIAAQTPVRERRRSSESGGVEPALERTLVRRKGRIAQAIGPAGGSIGR